MKIGLISDTHGLLRPEAVAALAGSDLIMHAGDVGSADILHALQRIAPTHAVRGNVDYGGWTDALPEALDVDAAGHRFHIVHRIVDLKPDIESVGIAAVVYGHSHQPSLEWRGGILYCNPGSAGPHRFKLPVTLARIEIYGPTLKPQIITLG